MSRRRDNWTRTVAVVPFEYWPSLASSSASAKVTLIRLEKPRGLGGSVTGTWVNSLSLNQTRAVVGRYENLPVPPTLTKGGISPKARSMYSPSSSSMSSMAHISMG